MDNKRTVTFRLKGKFPSDFSIERIAQYLRAVSALVGDDGVRLQKIGRGSVNFALEVPAANYPAVVYRVGQAKNPQLADPKAARAAVELETMISADQVTAEVLTGRTKILQLFGYRIGDAARIGPIAQSVSVRGRILGLEGKDRTKHARVEEYGTQREFSAEIVDEGLANRLKDYLWGEVIELKGTARLIRTAEGRWETKSFRLEAIAELGLARFSEVAASLRGEMNEDALTELARQLVRGRH
ncbi:hypothetical protein [Arenimonas fontis]|uniref:Uncharacterized protein n=1 Tax=Arenimonas fontis TaxID=2608255 RepID=A0A5B2ZA03_9GAMM|nr:hypothetical protein [Arenimonas fontis]KAA2283972.1 hypothetical protein F0415_11755 [Arenimonas fontis]